MARRKHTKTPGTLRYTAHAAFSPVSDRAAWLQSIEIDAVDDRNWFAEHPGASERSRPMSALEQQAMGLPFGTQVRVMRLQDGSQYRMFVAPGQG